MEKEIILKVEKVSKTFGPTRALIDVDADVFAGEIHGLIGENGSGKSTLSTIVTGMQKANGGKMYFCGKEYAPKNSVDASKKGVSMIVQEQNTVGGLTVASNIFCGEEDPFIKGGLLQLKKMRKEAAHAFEKLGVDHIDPEATIDDLTFEDRKMVELARAIYNDPKLLIVDETTTALTVKGRGILYQVMKKVRDAGGAVLFISHDIDEIMEMCDALTILRDGVKITSLQKEEFEVSKIRKLMVGREIADNLYRTDTKATKMDEVALKAEGVSYELLKDVSLTLHKGEILGIGGLTDCGMHDLGKVLFGLAHPTTGRVETGDGTRITSPIIAIEKEIGYVAKDRDRESLMPVGSIKDNVCSISWSDLAGKSGLISKRKEKEFANKWSEKLKVKMVDIEQFCTELSGGNKQKVVLAKWLGKDSETFIFDCPTRGIDVGVKAAIYRLMEELKAQGKAIVMISEELAEIIGMSDRVIILKEGKLTGEFMRDEMLTEETLINYMI